MRDPVMLEILRNRFAAIAEEMAVVTLRTGFTVFVKETADFGACLVSVDGEVFAAPTETALNFMVGLPAKHAIESIAHYEEGDVCISNDPEATQGMATHLPDIWTWKPIFADGEIIAFAFNFINATDVGGTVPGSLSPSSSEIQQEGLRIPPCTLFSRGELNHDVARILAANSRVPADNWGDLKAQHASLSTAERRLGECVERYGVATVTEAIDGVLEQAQERARAVIAQIPDGTWEFTDYVEADHVGLDPIRIKLALTVRGEELLLDFTGTDHQVRAAFNLPSWSQRGHYMICIPLLNYIRSVDPGIPYNSGMIRGVELTIPRETVLNPDHNAAVGVRAVTMIRVFDCILGCLAQALPNVFPAAGSGLISIVVLASVDAETGERRVNVAQPLIGGSGARPDKDGIDGSSFTGGWLRNVPSEVLETESPVLVEEYGYRTDTGGPGRTRGGLGMRFRMRMLGSETVMTARGLDRFHFRPWGLAGGHAGETSRVTLNPGAADERDLGKIDVLRLDSGDVVEFETSSGGGYGDPAERDPALVVDDLRQGLVTTASVRAAYGLDVQDGTLNDTNRVVPLADPPPFDFGSERAEYELVWTHEVSDAIVQALTSYPVRLRPLLQQRTRREIEARHRAVSACAAGDVEAIVAEISRSLRQSTTARPVQEESA